MTNRTCAILLSHPANPTGRCYTAETLARLAAAIERAEHELGVEITVIADETHRDFVGAGRFERAASHHARTLIVYSFGKYHFLQGQRIGYVATSPRHPARRALATELVRWTRVLGFVTPTALMQRALRSSCPCATTSRGWTPGASDTSTSSRARATTSYVPTPPCSCTCARPRATTTSSSSSGSAGRGARAARAGVP